MSSTVAAAADISRDFDYSTEQVQCGVQEYIREMYEGLSQNGATLSQIPTYVTNVPNGTEKVCSTFFKIPISISLQPRHAFFFDLLHTSLHTHHHQSLLLSKALI
jgi:hypothetical protein